MTVAFDTLNPAPEGKPVAASSVAGWPLNRASKVALPLTTSSGSTPEEFAGIAGLSYRKSSVTAPLLISLRSA